MGKMTASLSDSLANSNPATSFQLMFGFSMMMAPSNLVIIFFFSGSSPLSLSESFPSFKMGQTLVIFSILTSFSYKLRSIAVNILDN